MLRLTTFGGLTLRHEGKVLTGPPTQRRRLALLALLAAAGESGVTREKILAMLWPDGDPVKSRHALNQILSAQRRYFPDAALFDGRKTVRLNRAAIETDVWDLEAAIAQSNLDEAIRIYEGPFLDGFFINDSPEFEMWMSDARERISNRLLSALDNAALAASRNGNPEDEIKWRRFASELDRLDAQRAIHLADALIRSDNSLKALRVLEACQNRIQAELGITGDPALARRIESLKAELKK